MGIVLWKFDMSKSYFVLVDSSRFRKRIGSTIEYEGEKGIKDGSNLGKEASRVGLE